MSDVGIRSMDDVAGNGRRSSETPSLAELQALARSFETLIRSRQLGHGNEIAVDVGVSETKLSRFGTGEAGFTLSEVALFLAALTKRGLFFGDAPNGMRLVPEEKLAALTLFAADALDAMRKEIQR